MDRTMFSLLNEMLELIYVADTETHELLFMNDIGLKTFHIERLEGQKCYRILQGLEEPCPFCTTAMLAPDACYTWEFTNPITKRHYLLKDRLVDWKGHHARVEIAVDVTESQQEKIALKNALEAETMVMECVRQMYETDDIDGTIHNILAKAGAYMEADRSYLFEIRDGKMFNTYEWCAPGVRSEKENLQNLDISLINRWRNYFQKQSCVVIEDMEQIRESDPMEYQELSVQDIHSLVAAPLMKGDRLFGYLGVDNPPVGKIKNITTLLHTLRYFLMIAMSRIHDKELLTQLSFHDNLTGFFNRNRYILDIDSLTNIQEPIGAVYLDLNGLKDMNDLHGHAFGDKMLVTCAEKITSVFSQGYLYRVGGDEFIILCKGVSESCFQDQVTELKKRFALQDDCSASIGYSWTATGDNLTELISRADSMMYEDKRLYYKTKPRSNRFRHWGRG